MTMAGKKTYIVAVVIALASFAVAMGWLSQEQYQVILGLLGSLGLAALRSGVAAGEANMARELKAARAPGPFPGVDVGGPGVTGQ